MRAQHNGIARTYALEEDSLNNGHQTMLVLRHVSFAILSPHKIERSINARAISNVCPWIFPRVAFWRLFEACASHSYGLCHSIAYACACIILVVS